MCHQLPLNHRVFVHFLTRYIFKPIRRRLPNKDSRINTKLVELALEIITWQLINFSFTNINFLGRLNNGNSCEILQKESFFSDIFFLLRINLIIYVEVLSFLLILQDK